MVETTAEKRRKAIRTKYRNKVKSGEWAYSMRYDAYFNTKTRAWVEKKCSDKECTYCVPRPETAPGRLQKPQPQKESR